GGGEFQARGAELAVLGGVQAGERPPDHLVGRVPEQSLGPRVPRGDEPERVEQNDGGLEQVLKEQAVGVGSHGPLLTSRRRSASCISLLDAPSRNECTAPGPVRNQ